MRAAGLVPLPFVAGREASHCMSLHFGEIVGDVISNTLIPVIAVQERNDLAHFYPPTLR
jgi:hypothetical protein